MAYTGSALLLCVLLLASAVSAASEAQHPAREAWCRKVEAAQYFPEFSHVYECPRATGILLVPYLWRPVHLNIKCPTSWYSVYAAPDVAMLKQNFDKQNVAWCGWSSVLDANTCELSVSPFQTTLVGVKGGKGCVATSSANLSWLMLASGVAGLLLFFSAGFLSSSLVFRLSCGSALFTMASLLLVLVMVIRMLPHKRTVAAVATAAGSGGWALVRWLTGQWLPSWSQLIQNPVFCVYVLLSVAIGAICTYLYDDMANPKVNSVIKATLRGMALAMLYYATWTCWPVSATVMGVLIASLVGPGVAKGVRETRTKVQEMAQATQKLLNTPFSARRVRPRHAATAAGPSSPTRPHLLSLGKSQPHAPLQTPAVLWRQQAEPLGSPMAVDEVEKLELKEYRDITPLHLRAAPPAPWEVQAKRRVSTFEEQMQKAVTRQGRGATRRKGVVEAAGQSSEVQASAGPSNMTPPREEDQGVSQVVLSGYILNPASGRLIKIGGDVYNRLLEEGFTADAAAGTMVAPEGAEGGRSTPRPGRHSSGRTSARTSARVSSRQG